jgi:bacteriocin leader peptide (microcyclamide/patellamide family)
MDKKNLMPIAAQPVNRTTTGQLPPEQAGKAALGSAYVLPSGDALGPPPVMETGVFIPDGRGGYIRYESFDECMRAGMCPPRIRLFSS